MNLGAPGASPRILLVDEQPEDRALAALCLRQALPQARIEEVGGAVQFAEALAGPPCAAAVCELELSWGEASEVLAALKRRHPGCLAFLFTSAAAERIASGGVPLNLDGYLRKDSRGFLRLGGALRAGLEASAALRQHRSGTDARTEALERSKEELEQIAYALSHDLQEPLTLIARHARLLEERYRSRLDGDAEKFLRHLVESAGRMQTMIDGVLEYARIGKGSVNRETVALDGVVEEVLHNLQPVIAAAGAQVEKTALPTIRADRRQMVQLFHNLISNAVKFRGQEPLHICITATETEDDCRLAVCDNGIGIDPRDAERIFGMFQRLHTREEYPGTGVGLAICKRICESHGGSITVESARGRGARFVVTLPKGRSS